MAELTSMRNIGKIMEEKLKAVDICSAEELRQTGSKEAFSAFEIALPKCLFGPFIYASGSD